MLTPTRDYDANGNRTLSFTGFAASFRALRWLRKRGFSVGPKQGAETRGVLFGSASIGKWRSTLPLERLGLHGIVTCPSRWGPAQVTIRADAPPAARIAIVAEPIESPTGMLDCISDIAICGLLFGMVLFAFAVLPPAPPKDGKFACRVTPTPSPSLTMRGRP